MAAIERHNLEYASHKVRVPVPESFSGLSVHDCVNRFLNQKLDEQDAGQISERWYSDLYKVCQFILEQFGRDRAIESIEPNDFAKMRLVLVKKHSPTISRNLVSRVKSVFKFAKDTHLIDNEVDYGVSFKPPSKALVRKHRATKPKALWTPEQVNAMVDKCNTTMRAMILLAINSGVNNSDIANLPIKAIDFKTGWMDFPRAKTFVQRRVLLWPETLAALKEQIESKTETDDKDLIRLVFVTRWHKSWSMFAVHNELENIKKACDIELGSFTWFRKTVQTIGENTGDLIAVKAIMGHVDDSISDHYRQEVADERLRKVTDTICAWLFPKPAKAKGKRGAK